MLTETRLRRERRTETNISNDEEIGDRLLNSEYLPCSIMSSTDSKQAVTIVNYTYSFSEQTKRQAADLDLALTMRWYDIHHSFTTYNIDKKLTGFKYAAGEYRFA